MVLWSWWERSEPERLGKILSGAGRDPKGGVSVHPQGGEAVDESSPSHLRGVSPYRNLLGVKVMACGLPGSVTLPWLREMDSLTRDELKIRYLGFSDTVLDLESKVYSVLLDAAQGVVYLRYSTAMIQECNRGAGREAVKTLDRLYQYSKRTEMTDAADDWYLLTCTCIDEVGNFVASLRTAVAKLSSGGQ